MFAAPEIVESLKCDIPSGTLLWVTHSDGMRGVELTSHLNATSGPGSQYSMAQFIRAVGVHGEDTSSSSRFCCGAPPGLRGERDACGDP